MQLSLGKTITLTTLALLAFAGNSILCRLALGNQTIDATSFTILRLASGAFVLCVLIAVQSLRQQNQTLSDRLTVTDLLRQHVFTRTGWVAPIALFVYATLFSWAYVGLDTGVGALILFGTVQLTMIIASLIKGTRLMMMEWVGVLCALLGFVYLMLPSILDDSVHLEGAINNTDTISGVSFMMMLVSGIAWGLYTVLGRQSANPIVTTSANFLKALPLLVILLIVLVFYDYTLSLEGVIYALLSGAFASGLGYAIWYAALAGLSGIQAAVVQLLVPVIAAIGGFIFVGEAITLSFVVASVVILGGIFLVTLARRKG